MKYKGQGAQLNGPYNGNKDGQDSENADMHGAIRPFGHFRIVRDEHDGLAFVTQTPEPVHGWE